MIVTISAAQLAIEPVKDKPQLVDVKLAFTVKQSTGAILVGRADIDLVGVELPGDNTEPGGPFVIGSAGPPGVIPGAFVNPREALKKKILERFGPARTDLGAPFDLQLNNLFAATLAVGKSQQVNFETRLQRSLLDEDALGRDEIAAWIKVKLYLFVLDQDPGRPEGVPRPGPFEFEAFGFSNTVIV